MTRISAGTLEVAPSSNGRSALSTGANGFESARSL